ncbi:hypothetical protein [Streptomyces sp. NPDC002758]
MSESSEFRPGQPVIGRTVEHLRWFACAARSSRSTDYPPQP